jgi:hypothetical protein
VAAGLELISPEVRRFLAERIDSVGQLEVLLLVRSDPARYWSVPEVSAVLRSDRTWARVQLEELRAHGLLPARESSEPRYRYHPAGPGLDAVVARLSHSFETRRADVIRLVFRKRST